MFVGNLSASVSEETLYKHFHKYGDIDSIKILTPKESTSGKNIAFINFFKQDQAVNAKTSMEGKLISGHQIKIKWGKKLSNKPGLKSCDVLPNMDMSNKYSHGQNYLQNFSSPYNQYGQYNQYNQYGQYGQYNQFNQYNQYGQYNQYSIYVNEPKDIRMKKVINKVAKLVAEVNLFYKNKN